MLKVRHALKFRRVLRARPLLVFQPLDQILYRGIYITEAFNSTSSYLDDFLNIDNPYFEGIINQIYPPELQLNKGNISDTKAPFLDLHLSVANGFVSSKIYDNRFDFDFDIVNFPFLDGNVPGRASYGVYISQLIRFARVCNHVTDFNAYNRQTSPTGLSVS